MVGVRLSCAVPPFGVAVGTSTRTGAMGRVVDSGFVKFTTLLVAVATATVVGVAVLGSSVLVGSGVAVAVGAVVGVVVGIVVGVSITGAVGILVGSTLVVGDVARVSGAVCEFVVVTGAAAWTGAGFGWVF